LTSLSLSLSLSPSSVVFLLVLFNFCVFVKDPTRVIARSSEPLISPTYGWEKGDSPWLGLTPNVVFLEGWRPYTLRNSFIAYFGGADSVIGAALIHVEIQ
jgi:predicted GH43/DUF377 family glycosyl hydrolase